MTPTVRPARPDEIAPVGRLIAESFDHLDANRYLVPSEADRIRIVPCGVVRIRLRSLPAGRCLAGRVGNYGLGELIWALEP